MEAERYLVIDFEATCCDKGTVPRGEMEIIEVGAVMVEAGTFEVIGEFQTFIRPARHPQLTPFCISLTSITQTDVDAAPAFADAMPPFKEWLDRHPGFVFCSWGDYDLKQLNQDCDFHFLPSPVSAPHCNVKRKFAERQYLSKEPGLGEAIRLARLEFAGTHHRGIDDARNIARLLPYVFGSASLLRGA
ncbi:MAG TPA: 3'-5' exonuclease [Prosthecobacter sp.]